MPWGSMDHFSLENLSMQPFCGIPGNESVAFLTDDFYKLRIAYEPD
jgi:hypothetical protein